MLLTCAYKVTLSRIETEIVLPAKSTIYWAVLTTLKVFRDTLGIVVTFMICLASVFDHLKLNMLWFDVLAKNVDQYIALLLSCWTKEAQAQGVVFVPCRITVAFSWFLAALVALRYAYTTLIITK